MATCELERVAGIVFEDLFIDDIELLPSDPNPDIELVECIDEGLDKELILSLWLFNKLIELVEGRGVVEIDFSSKALSILLVVPLTVP